MEKDRQGFCFKNLFISFTTRKAILFILIVGLIVYFNSLLNGFVADDGTQIVNNLYVHSVRNLLTFFTGSTFYNGGIQHIAGVYYKPLLSTYFSTIYTLFGSNSFIFHLIQLILHIINTCVLFFVFKQFFNKKLSFFLALIFLIHPINSEVVFYIANAQDILFFLFGILAFYLLLNLRSNKYFVLISTLSLFSLLSKETGILFILVCALYVFIFENKYLLKLVIYTIPMICLYTLLRLNAVGLFAKPLSSPIATLSLTNRILNIPEMLLFYLKTFIFPFRLSSSYQWVYTSFGFDNFFLPLIINVLVLAVLVYIGYLFYKFHTNSHFRIYLFFSGWLLLGLLLHLQFIPLDATVAERWFYFSMVGLLGMIGVCLEAFKVKLNKMWMSSVIIIVVVMLSLTTYLRSFDWRNDFTLNSHDIKISQAYDLENGISYELLKQGRLDEAKSHAEKSIASFPYLTNLNTLGLIYLNLGNYQKAKEAYLNALKFGDYYVTYENLGGLTLLTGDSGENIVFLKSALKKFPTDSKLWLYLAIIEYNLNEVKEAKNAITNAYYYDRSSNNLYFYKSIMNNEPIKVSYSKNPQ